MVKKAKKVEAEVEGEDEGAIVHEYETTVPDVILDGEGIDVDDPNVEGGKRHELKLPVGHVVRLSEKAARNHQERGVGLRKLDGEPVKPLAEVTE